MALGSRDVAFLRFFRGAFTMGCHLRHASFLNAKHACVRPTATMRATPKGGIVIRSRL